MTSNAPTPTPNREQWLQSAIHLLRPACSSVGLTIPSLIHVSVGFPSTRALSRTRPRIGECWSPAASKDGNPHIYISPVLSQSLDALSTLVHELVHAAGIHGHGAKFRRPAVALGLEGKMTATEPGPELTQRLNALVADDLGPYPHVQLNPSARPTKKQTTRLLKATCTDCEAIIRLTAKVCDNPGLPTCACGGLFEI